MPFVLVLTGGLVAWSLVANLLGGDAHYVVRNLVLAGLLLVVASRVGIPRSGLGLRADRLASGGVWGLAAVLLAAAVVAVGVALADHVRPVALLLADERAHLPPEALVHHVLLRIPLGTAVFEEVAFRGVLLGALLRTTSTGRAVAWSSLAFGLWHVAPTIVALQLNAAAPASPGGLVTIAGAVAITVVAGAAFSALRLVSGSLLAPILAHWATNAFGLVAAARDVV